MLSGSSLTGPAFSVPMRIFGPLQVLQDADRMADIAFDGADGVERPCGPPACHG